MKPTNNEKNEVKTPSKYLGPHGVGHWMFRKCIKRDET